MQKQAQSFEIETDDHKQISATLYQKDLKGKHLIIIGPAAGAPQYYYANFANFTMNQSEFDVVTFDYRDVGASKTEPIKTSKSSMADWGRHDLNAVIGWGSDKYDKIFLLGHSVAGQVFPLAENRRRIEAAYFVASAAPFLTYWKGWGKFQVLLFWYLIIPITTLIYGYLPGWAMGGKTSLPKGVAHEWRKWGLNKNGIVLSDTDAKRKYNEIGIPIHFLGFSDDNLFAPSDAIQALMHKYGNGKTFFQYVRPKDLGAKSIGHFGFFRKNHEKLWSMPIMFFSQYIRKFD